MKFELKPQPIPCDYNTLKDDHLALIKQFEQFTQFTHDYIEKKDAYIRYLKKELFSANSDTPNFAIKLFNEAEFIFDVSEQLNLSGEQQFDETPLPVNGHYRKKAKRQQLPEHLPRIDIIHDLSNEEKICPHDGHTLHKMGEDVSEELKYVPSKYEVIRHITFKYGCRHCEDGIKKPLLEEKLIPKSYCTPSLLTHIVMSKYQHHLPLYRLEKMFAQQGIKISRTSMSEWVVVLGKAIQPLINIMWEDLLKGDYLQMDETPLQVLNVGEESTNKKTYMWVSASWHKDTKLILYEYDATRSSQVPIRLLTGFSGYLQTDGYAGYNEIANNPDIMRVGCMAHLRRYFVKVLEGFPQNERHKHPAARAMALIKKLYLIEKEIRDKSSDERLEARTKISKPLFNELEEYIAEEFPKVLPKSPYGKALAYSIKELPYIARYLECGNVEIDNNRIENCIRPFALGKKNWLFSNTEKGAQASANIYSLIETLKANGKNVEKYLNEPIEKLPSCKKIEDYDALLPY